MGKERREGERGKEGVRGKGGEGGKEGVRGKEGEGGKEVFSVRKRVMYVECVLLL